MTLFQKLNVFYFILYYLLCKFALVLLVTLISPFDKT